MQLEETGTDICIRPAHCSAPLSCLPFLHPQSCWYYPAYCLSAGFPPCIHVARQVVADKYNLEDSGLEPGDCSTLLIKCIGLRLLCFASACLFPCFHVTQMRAEVSYRKHGKATVFPCCCCSCGGGEGPPGPSNKDDALDYPRQSTARVAIHMKKPGDAALDYPFVRAIAPGQGAVKKAKPVTVELDYPRAGTAGLAGVKKTSGLVEKVVLDYPRAGPINPSLAVANNKAGFEEVLPDYPHLHKSDFMMALGKGIPEVGNVRDFPRLQSMSPRYPQNSPRRALDYAQYDYPRAGPVYPGPAVVNEKAGVAEDLPHFPQLHRSDSLMSLGKGIPEVGSARDFPRTLSMSPMYPENSPRDALDYVQYSYPRAGPVNPGLAVANQNTGVAEFVPDYPRLHRSDSMRGQNKGIPKAGNARDYQQALSMIPMYPQNSQRDVLDYSQYY